MGRVLFIRVSAETYDEKDVVKAWPSLFAAVWPNADVESDAAPAKLSRALMPFASKSALALVDAFVEYVRFGELAESSRAALSPHAKTLESLRAELDAALGNRDVPAASKLTDAIENALDEAEAALR